eukprot:CAMPEP_0174938254 /NCGR_PEP_ID=MMETSP1355-20121228/62894_1 /TAXON_ID=464990 /ORGANISM="Hemiselmis tepida, Strain CCMP443" /LENGTH=55 /DNA_ID=CAMNT_0016185165 /DNA_START=63 /DNA_END=226 /DNA_ORIENTATION=+
MVEKRWKISPPEKNITIQKQARISPGGTISSSPSYVTGSPLRRLASDLRSSSGLG